jgi:hypothetical protein
MASPSASGPAAVIFTSVADVCLVLSHHRLLSGGVARPARFSLSIDRRLIWTTVCRSRRGILSSVAFHAW